MIAHMGSLNGVITHLTDIKGTGFVKNTHSLTDVIANYPGFILIEDSTVSGSLVDALNVTGKGILHTVVQRGETVAAHCQITIDGVISSNVALNVNTLSEWQLNKGYETDTFALHPGAADLGASLGVVFKTSLRIQHSSQGGGGTSNIKIWYSII